MRKTETCTAPYVLSTLTQHDTTEEIRAIARAPGGSKTRRTTASPMQSRSTPYTVHAAFFVFLPHRASSLRESFVICFPALARSGKVKTRCLREFVAALTLRTHSIQWSCVQDACNNQSRNLSMSSLNQKVHKRVVAPSYRIHSEIPYFFCSGSGPPWKVGY